ncbi:MAG: PD40 domain-containing protein [Saprospiraceae bacterium]|nr:PD40 domain-containing protein [Saprospiraceae bacterium]
MRSRLCHNSYFLISLLFVLSCHVDRKEELNKYLLAYNVAVDVDEDDYDIFILDPIKRTHKNITRDPDVAWTYLAYDGQIFFISDRDTCKRCYYLYEMDARGENVRRIADFPLRDSWMGVRNKGTELVVNPSSKVDSAFYIIDRHGKILSKIYTGLPYASDPSFSPDGKLIAFRGARKKSKREQGFNEALYVIQSDGTGIEKITDYPAADTTAPWFAYKAGPPRWHPTENFISYQSFQSGKYSLYAVDPEDSRSWKLTGNEVEEGWHDWSPDGQWLAIEVFDSDQTQFHIMLMNWANKTTTILTDSLYQYQQAPVFVRK